MVNHPNLGEPLGPELGEHPEELLEVVGHVRLDVLLQRLPVLVLEEVRDGGAGRQGTRLLRRRAALLDSLRLGPDSIDINVGPKQKLAQKQKPPRDAKIEKQLS